MLDFDTLKNTLLLIAGTKYGNHFILKGGTALMLKVLVAGRLDLLRKTVDIDIHLADSTIWDSFCTDCIPLLNNNTIGYYYTNLNIKRRTPESASIVLDVTRNGETDKLKFDVNFKLNNCITVSYLAPANMNCYDNCTMLADKILVVSSQKVYRRIKDVYDIAVLAQLEEYTSDNILQHLMIKNPKFFTEGKNMLTPQNYNDLKHAYDLFTGINNKPAFDVLYQIVSTFLNPIYTQSKGYAWKGGVWY